MKHAPNRRPELVGGSLVRASSDPLARLRAAISGGSRDVPGVARVSVHLAAAVDESAPTAVIDTSSVRHEAPEREAAERLLERLAAVRPTLAHLRALLSGSVDGFGASRRSCIELAAADVQRSLAQARRTMRALRAVLSDLDAEGQELTVDAALLVTAHERNRGC